MSAEAPDFNTGTIGATGAAGATGTTGKMQKLKIKAKTAVSTNPTIVIIVGLGLVLIAVILLILYLTAKGNAETKCSTSKYTKWPKKGQDRAFSIRLRDTDRCLQPKVVDDRTSVNDTNLILNDGCDDDHLRFNILPDGQIQKYKPPSKNYDKTNMCLKAKTVNDGGEIIYNNNCDDNDTGPIEKTLRFTYQEDGKIRHNISNLCLRTDNSDAGSLIKLKKCEEGSKFDLI
jgi:hypothetical protein